MKNAVIQIQGIKESIKESIYNLIPRNSKRLFKNIIKRYKRTGLFKIRSGSICIFSPIFDEERLKDGYYRRVKNVDDILGDAYYKIYIFSEDSDCERISINSVSDERVEITYNYTSKLQLFQLKVIALFAGRMYFHSVLTISNEKFFKWRCIKKIVDLHGSVPEEFRMSGAYIFGQLCDDKEEIVAKRADLIIAVTDAMKKYFVQKHQGYFRSQIITIPIVDESYDELRRVDITDIRPYCGGKPIVTYAGGLQNWQMIPYMQDVISATSERLVYRIFVPYVDEFMRLWGDRPNSGITVESKNQEELGEEYEECHYGFLLRENIIVNNVACPTKLFEYIIHGIVPVLNTPYIGDFYELGLKYIAAADLLNNRLPTESERIKMANENRKVLLKMKDQYENGKKQLLKGLI